LDHINNVNKPSTGQGQLPGSKYSDHWATIDKTEVIGQSSGRACDLVHTGQRTGSQLTKNGAGGPHITKEWGGNRPRTVQHIQTSKEITGPHSINKEVTDRFQAEHVTMSSANNRRTSSTALKVHVRRTQRRDHQSSSHAMSAHDERGPSTTQWTAADKQRAHRTESSPGTC